jgi:hypothetical protein
MNFNKITRIGVNSFTLVIINIASVIVAFGLYKIIHQNFPLNQITTQAPIAALLSISGYLVWSLIVHKLKPSINLQLQKLNEYVWVFLASLLWNPIIFIPLHYFTQGYLTSSGNIINFWLFQIPVNLLSLLTAANLVNHSRKSGHIHN